MKDFTRLLEEMRTARQMSKRELAERARLSAPYISLLTRGGREDPSEETVKALSDALELDSVNRARLLKAAGYYPSHLPSGNLESQLRLAEENTHQLAFSSENWDDAPDVRVFYGRRDETATLKRWLLEDHCKVVTVLGLGGVGKTTLCAALVMTIKKDFDFVFWLSLQNAPPLENILRTCIQFMAGHGPIDLPDNEEDQIVMLLKFLRDERCLLVLDNFETILQSRQRAGHYREGYEGYGKLIRRIGETSHKSCLLLTSREKPKELARLEGIALSVRSLQLSGVGHVEGRAILKDKGLFGSDEDFDSLIQLYSGNPLALKLISASIHEVFEGDITRYRQEQTEGKIVFSDLSDLLKQQFDRLSEHEQEILYWLAIEREAVSLHDLRENIVRLVSREVLMETLDSLRRRSMIESSESALFTSQPVISEYVTHTFVNEICSEIEQGAIRLLGSHALIKAQAKDYVLNSQIHFILRPIADWMLMMYGKEDSERQLKHLLTTLRESRSRMPEYAAGNILNLLVELGCDLRGYDFSSLMVWQAHLRGVALPEVNFANADLATSVFTDTFGSILSVALSPDGTLLAAGTANNQVRLWYASSGIPYLTCPGHTDWVFSVAFSPDGKYLASGSEDHSVRLWEVSTGQCLNILSGHTSRVWSVAFSHDGKQLISGSHDQTVRIWDIETGLCLNILSGHTSRIWSVAFSPTEKLIASGSEGQNIRLWDAETGKCLTILEGHSGWVRSVAFSQDGKFLASGSEDQTVRLWEVSTRRHIKTLHGHTSRVCSVAFNPAGTLLASGSDDHSVRLWDISTGQCLKALEGHGNWVSSVAFSPDGQTLASGSYDQTVHLWKVSTGQRLKWLLGFAFLVESLSFSPDGQVLASGSEDLSVRLWNSGTGQLFRSLRGHTNGVRSVTFSPNGKLLATGSGDQTVRIWDSYTSRCLYLLRGHTNRIWSVAFSPDSTLLASSSEDQTVRLWDISTQQSVAIFRGHTNWVWSVAFSPDSTLLATGSGDQTIRIWNTNTKLCLKVLRGHTNRIWSVTFSPDSTLLASSSEDQTVRLWDIDTGQCLNVLTGHSNIVKSVTFSPDGKLLASGSHDQTIRLWSAETGQCVAILRGHRNQVRAVTFSPDSKILATGSYDGTIRLWDVKTCECLRVLRSDLPYEHMNITEVRGLTLVQLSMLKELGAVETA